jgi:hypothetical protein
VIASAELLGASKMNQSPAKLASRKFYACGHTVPHLPCNRFETFDPRSRTSSSHGQARQLRD